MFSLGRRSLSNGRQSLAGGMIWKGTSHGRSHRSIEVTGSGEMGIAVYASGSPDTQDPESPL